MALSPELRKAHKKRAKAYRRLDTAGIRHFDATSETRRAEERERQALNDLRDAQTALEQADQTIVELVTQEATR